MRFPQTVWLKVEAEILSSLFSTRLKTNLISYVVYTSLQLVNAIKDSTANSSSKKANLL